MTTSEDPTICRTCNQSHEGPLVPKHPFNDGSLPMSATFGPRRADGSGSRPSGPQRGFQRPAMPMDPVLRQALVDKGILTPQDLRDAEEKIQAITGMFNDPGSVTRKAES